MCANSAQEYQLTARDTAPPIAAWFAGLEFAGVPDFCADALTHGRTAFKVGRPKVSGLLRVSPCTFSLIADGS